MLSKNLTNSFQMNGNTSSFLSQNTKKTLKMLRKTEQRKGETIPLYSFRPAHYENEVFMFRVPSAFFGFPFELTPNVYDLYRSALRLLNHIIFSEWVNRDIDFSRQLRTIFTSSITGFENSTNTFTNLNRTKGSNFLLGTFGVVPILQIPISTGFRFNRPRGEMISNKLSV